MSLIHDLGPGDEDAIRVVIEIPRGSKNKYEIDKETGYISLDRAMHTAQDYPMDYGFVPQTHWDDDDPLDVAVLTTYPLYPGIIVYVRPVGIIRMIDGGDSDDKLIGVPVDDPRFDEIKDIGDVNRHTIKEIQHFFETYKRLQEKEVVINGVENVAAAKESFHRACKLYKDKYNK